MKEEGSPLRVALIFSLPPSLPPSLLTGLLCIIPINVASIVGSILAPLPPPPPPSSPPPKPAIAGCRPDAPGPGGGREGGRAAIAASISPLAVHKTPHPCSEGCRTHVCADSWNPAARRMAPVPEAEEKLRGGRSWVSGPAWRIRERRRIRGRKGGRDGGKRLGTGFRKRGARTRAHPSKECWI